MNIYKYTLIWIICVVSSMSAFPASAKPCTPNDFIHYMNGPQYNMVYRTIPGAEYPANIAIQYDKKNSLWIGRYAQPNISRPVELVEKHKTNNSVYMKSSDKNSDIDYFEFRFKNVSEHRESNWNDSCQIILATVKFNNNKKKELYLITDTVNNPEDKSEQKINERTALNIKKLYLSNSGIKLSDLFSYPARLCTPNSPNVAIILKSPKDVLKYQNKIITKYEKKFIKHVIPYNLPTEGPYSNFAQNTIYIVSGLIKSMCIQGKYNTFAASVCTGCK